MPTMTYQQYRRRRFKSMHRLDKQNEFPTTTRGYDIDQITNFRPLPSSSSSSASNSHHIIIALFVSFQVNLMSQTFYTVYSELRRQRSGTGWWRCLGLGWF